MRLYLWFAIAGFKYPCFVVLLETMGPFLPVGNLFQAVKGFYPAGEWKLWVLFRLGSPRVVPSRLLSGLARSSPSGGLSCWWAGTGAFLPGITWGWSFPGCRGAFGLYLRSKAL